MLKRFTISFRYTKAGEKKPGPIQRFVLYAEDLPQAEQLARRYANYTNVRLINVRQT